MKRTNNPDGTAQRMAPSDDLVRSEDEPTELVPDNWDEAGEDEIRRLLRYGAVGGSRVLD